jgi:hypothetical protein
LLKPAPERRAQGRNDDFQAGCNEFQAGRNEFQAGRNKIKAGRNKIQVRFPSSNQY